MGVLTLHRRAEVALAPAAGRRQQSARRLADEAARDEQRNQERADGDQRKQQPARRLARLMSAVIAAS
jgi:hypothetical protein